MVFPQTIRQRRRCRMHGCVRKIPTILHVKSGLKSPYAAPMDFAIFGIPKRR